MILLFGDELTKRGMISDTKPSTRGDRRSSTIIDFDTTY